MTASEYIRRLIRRFPGLKPAAIRRLAAANGFAVTKQNGDGKTVSYPVDNNLVVVTRHRDLEWKRKLAVANVLGEFAKRCPDLALAVMHDEALTKAAADLLDKNPSLKRAEVAALLDEEVAKGRVPLNPDLDAERRAMVYKKVLDEHPEYRRATELTFGAKNILASVLYAPGIEGWSDDELREAILAELQRLYPPAATVEEIAAKVIENEKRDNIQKVLSRAESILDKIEQAVGGVPDRVAALKLIAVHALQHPGVPDEDVIDGMFLNRDRDTDELRENYREVEFEFDGKKRVAGVRLTGDRDRLKFTKYKGRSF